MEYITYEYRRIIRPEEIEIETDDEFFRMRGRTFDDWENLIEIAKASAHLLSKQSLNQPLNDLEKQALYLFYGQEKIIIQVAKDGKLEIGDGRHRMLALKKANVALRLPVCAFLEVQRIQIKETDVKISNDKELNFNYFLVTKSEEMQKRLNQSGYAPFVLKALRDEAEYLVVSNKNIENKEKFIKDVISWKRDKDVLFGTKDKIEREERD